MTNPNSNAGEALKTHPFFFLLSALTSLLSPENPLPPICLVAQGSSIHGILAVPGCKIHPNRVTNLTMNESVGSRCQLVDVTCREELPSATSLLSKTLISGQWNWALQVPLGEGAFSSCFRKAATTPPVLLAPSQNVCDSLTALILIKMAFGKLLHCHPLM